MDDQGRNIYARLTMHEFVIEVMLANVIASLSKNQADVFLNDLKRRARSGWTTDQAEGDNPDILPMMQDISRMIENMAEKASRRSEEIRARWAESS